jgi:dTMP kinase
VSSNGEGRFIVLEGPDGAGKSSQFERLERMLRERGREVVATREPGGTPMGQRIRAVVLSAGLERSAATDALLFNAARSELVRTVIRPALERGATVLCDRFAPSTLAYQGYGGGVDLAVLRGMEKLATGGIEPDLVLLLDVSPDVGFARRAAGDEVEQRTAFDSVDRAFVERVRAGYLAQAAADPARWAVIDASGSRDEVWAGVSAAVTRFLGGSEPAPVAVRMPG